MCLCDRASEDPRVKRRFGQFRTAILSIPSGLSHTKQEQKLSGLQAKTREALKARQGGSRPAVTGAGRAQKRAAREGVQGGQEKQTRQLTVRLALGMMEMMVVKRGATKQRVMVKSFSAPLITERSKKIRLF